MPDHVIKTEFDTSGVKSGADSAVRDFERTGQASDRAGEKIKHSAAKASEAQERLSKTAQRALRSFKRVSGNLDPVIKKERLYEQATRSLNEALKRGFVGQKEHARLLGLADKKYRQAEKSSGLLTRSVKGLSAAYLGFRAFDVLDSALEKHRDFEVGLRGVAKTTSLTDAQLEALEDRFAVLGTGDLPVAIDLMYELGEAAGQAGVGTSAGVQEMVETVGALEHATEDLKGSGAVNTLARMLNVQGEGPENVRRLASQIVHLGNNSAASEGEIAKIGLQVALSTSQFRIGTGAAAAYGATLAESGVQAQLGGSVLGRTFRAINDAVEEGGATLDRFAAISGTSSREFSEMWRRDPVEAVNLFVAALGRGPDAAATLSSKLESVGLAGDEIMKVLPALAINSDRLAEKFRLMAAEAQDVSALTNEAAAAFSTGQASAQRFENALALAGASLAEGFAPKVDAVTGRLVLFLRENDDVIRMIGEDLGTAVEIGGAALELLLEHWDEVKLVVVGVTSIKAVSWIQGIATAAPSAAAGLTKIAGAVNPLGAAIAAAVAVGLKLNDWIDDWIDRSEAVIAANVAAGESFRSIGENAREIASGGTLQDLSDLLGDYRTKLDELTASQAEQEAEASRLRATYARMVRDQGEHGRITRQVKAELEEHLATLNDTRIRAAEYRKAVEDVKEAMADWQGQAEATTTALGDHEDQVEEVAGAAESWLSGLREQIRVLEALQSVEASSGVELRQLAGDYQELGRQGVSANSAIGQEALRLLQRERDLTEALEERADALDALQIPGPKPGELELLPPEWPELSPEDILPSEESLRDHWEIHTEISEDAYRRMAGLAEDIIGLSLRGIFEGEWDGFLDYGLGVIEQIVAEMARIQLTNALVSGAAGGGFNFGSFVSSLFSLGGGGFSGLFSQALQAVGLGGGAAAGLGGATAGGVTVSTTAGGTTLITNTGAGAATASGGASAGAGASLGTAAATAAPLIAFAALMAWGESAGRSIARKRFGNQITAGYNPDGGFFGRQAAYTVGGDAAAAGAAQMRTAVAEILASLGSLGSAFPEVGVKIRNDGEKFLAIFRESVSRPFQEVGLFDTFEEALQAAMVAGLRAGDFEGMGANAQAALRNTDQNTVEGILGDVSFARELDNLKLSEYQQLFAALSEEMFIGRQRVDDLGLSHADYNELMLQRVEAERDGLDAQLDSILGISGQAQALVDLEARILDFNAGVEEAIPTLLDFEGRVDSSGDTLRDLGGDLGGLDDQVGDLGEDIVDLGGVVTESGLQFGGLGDGITTVSGKVGETTTTLSDMQTGLDHLRQGAEATDESLLKVDVDRLAQAMGLFSDSATAGIWQELGAALGNQELINRGQRLATEVRLHQLRAEIENYRQLGIISRRVYADMLAFLGQAFDALEQQGQLPGSRPIHFSAPRPVDTGVQQREERRRQLREELRLMRLREQGLSELEEAVMIRAAEIDEVTEEILRLSLGEEFAEEFRRLAEAADLRTLRAEHDQLLQSYRDSAAGLTDFDFGLRRLNDTIARGREQADALGDSHDELNSLMAHGHRELGLGLLNSFRDLGVEVQGLEALNISLAYQEARLTLLRAQEAGVLEELQERLGFTVEGLLRDLEVAMRVRLNALVEGQGGPGDDTPTVPEPPPEPDLPEPPPLPQFLQPRPSFTPPVVDEAQAAQEALERLLERLREGFEDFYGSLTLGDLNPLPDELQLEQAVEQMQDFAAQARAGSTEAQEQLLGLLPQVLRLGKATEGGATLAYAELFDLVAGLAAEFGGLTHTPLAGLALGPSTGPPVDIVSAPSGSPSLPYEVGRLPATTLQAGVEVNRLAEALAAAAPAPASFEALERTQAQMLAELQAIRSNSDAERSASADMSRSLAGMRDEARLQTATFQRAGALRHAGVQ